jgi:hypothetical protein
MESVPLVDKLTVFLKLLNSGDHFTVKFAGSGVVRWTLAWSVVMLKMSRVWAISNCPLSSLLDSKETKWAIALSGGSLAFSTLRTDTAWWLTSTIANKKDLLQSGHGLFGTTNDDGIADRRAVSKNGFLHSLESWITSALWGWRHHFAQWLCGNIIRVGKQFHVQPSSFFAVCMAVDIHRFFPSSIWFLLLWLCLLLLLDWLCRERLLLLLLLNLLLSLLLGLLLGLLLC